MTTSTRRLPRACSVLEACSDERLLGGSVCLWPRQREWLEGIEAGPRTHVLAAGRRASKTTAGAIVGVHACTLRPRLREALRPGERGYAVGVATSLRQARLFVAAARSLVERSPLLAPLVEFANEDEIAFETGHSLTAFPCTARSGRGWAIHTLVLDEFAHHLDVLGDSNAESVWRALVPSTAQFGDEARIVVASTPAGSSGFFADLYGRASSGELADARAYHATTAEANPTISAEFVASERIALGEEAFRAEYEASFEGGAGFYFADEELRAVVRERDEVLPEDGRGWVLALDPSSGAENVFAAVLVAKDARQGFEGRLLVGEVFGWKPRSGRRRLSRRTRAERDLWLDSTLDQVAAIAKRYRAAVVSDQHLPGVVLDELAPRGISHARIRAWNTQRKNDAFASLRARVVSERISLPNESGLLSELRRTRRRARAGGGTGTIEVPRFGDSHGDLAVALALGVDEHDRGGLRAPVKVWSPADVELPAVDGVPIGETAHAHRHRRALVGAPPTHEERAFASRAGLEIWEPGRDPEAGRW